MSESLEVSLDNGTFVPDVLVLPIIIIDIMIAIAAIPLEITVVGSVIADLIGVILSFLLKDWFGVVLSLIAMIPVIGSLFGGIKVVYKGGKIVRFLFKGVKLVK